MAKAHRKTRSTYAKVRGVFIEHVDRYTLLLLYDGRCGICGKKVRADQFTVDHIIPASRGGTHGYDNCQPAHALCNTLKADLLPDELGPIRHIIKERQKEKRRRKQHVDHRSSRRRRKPAARPAT